MIIKVRVVPNSKSESVREEGERNYKVKVREKALEGRANAAVIEALARHFGVKRSQVSIVSGASAREKTIEVASQAETR